MTTRTANGELLTITPGKARGDGPEYWEMREHLQNNGGCVDWDYWLELSQWTPTEAACLADAVDPAFWQRPDLSGYNNEAHAHTRPASDEIKKLIRWTTDKSQEPQSPSAWVAILRNGGYILPPALAGIQAPQDAPARDESPSKRRAFTQEPAEHYPLPDPFNESWREDSAMELIERRMCAISWVIESKGFERLALENGEKGHIKEFCEDSEPKLFRGSTVFDDAWKRGSTRKWWRMANYAKYMKNRGS